MSYRRKSKQPRRKESTVTLLINAPWWISMLISVAMFAGIRWVIPAFAEHNIILRSIAGQLSPMVWLFSGFFFVISLMSYIREKSDTARYSLAISESPGSGWQERVNRYAAQQELPPLDDRVSVELEAVMARVSRKAQPTEWSVELLRQLEWKRFEEVCQKFYELNGIEAKSTPLGADGGIDIFLFEKGSDKPASVVQCKAWNHLVGVKLVRELLGVMSHEKIVKGHFMATSGFTEEAKSFAKANHIRLVDGPTLISVIKEMPESAQAALLAFATEGDYTTPTCPSCGIKMRRISGTHNRADFWGCHNYPRCRQKINIRSDSNE